MSSWVGEAPPAGTTKSKVRAQYATSSAISGISSGTTATRLNATPSLHNSRAAKYELLSWTLPDRISFPTTTIAQVRSAIPLSLPAKKRRFEAFHYVRRDRCAARWAAGTVEAILV